MQSKCNTSNIKRTYIDPSLPHPREYLDTYLVSRVEGCRPATYYWNRSTDREKNPGYYI